jgi:hypothetical protein
VICFGIAVGDFSILMVNTPSACSAETSVSEGVPAQTVFVRLVNGDGTFPPATHHIIDAATEAMTAADLNRDGLRDIAFVARTDGIIVPTNATPFLLRRPRRRYRRRSGRLSRT